MIGRIFDPMGFEVIDDDVNGLVAVHDDKTIFLCELEFTEEPINIDLPNKTCRSKFELAINELIYRYSGKMPVNVPIKYAHVQVHVPEKTAESGKMHLIVKMRKADEWKERR